MGGIVGCFGIAHILFNPAEVEKEADQMVAGTLEFGRRVQTTKPGAIIAISGDHMFDIDMAWQIPICVGVSE